MKGRQLADGTSIAEAIRVGHGRSKTSQRDHPGIRRLAAAAADRDDFR